MSVHFQLVQPRHRVPFMERRRDRPSAVRLRVFLTAPGEEKKRHLATLAVPASPSELEAFEDLCSERLAEYGVIPGVREANVRSIRARVALESHREQVRIGTARAARVAKTAGAAEGTDGPEER